VFTAVCVALSATGHVLAACATVPPWTLAAGFAGVFALVLPFAGRPRSLPAVATSLAAGQLGLHALFGYAQHRLPAGPRTDELLIGLAARLVCGPGTAPPSPAEARRIVTAAGITPPAHDAHTGTAAELWPELVPGLPMVLAHLLAALATGWLLRHGDLALLRLAGLSAESAAAAAKALAETARLRSLRAALVLAALLCAGAAPGPRPGAGARRSRASAPPLPAEALHHTVIRRGPPVRFALAA
jgi:hypothetical protein